MVIFNLYLKVYLFFKLKKIVKINMNEWKRISYVNGISNSFSSHPSRVYKTLKIDTSAHLSIKINFKFILFD